ncbi:tetratricopeptide repeat protein [Methanoregula sp.]|uniref:tetratricopeptide repeat protein n=1 Tax=Methanoregula sp. TaxID=2052170 RepID=UPI002BC89EAC|nr:tetratricopeptide repeat protein [Methanoregula sp.]HVP96001.1 tetratricopeptide repeat protein [Methanoregula sp.]
MRSHSLVLILLILAASFMVLPPALSEPTDSAGWFAAGQSLTDTGNYSAGESAYKQAIALDPNNAEAWNGLADVLNRANQYTTDPLATLKLALEASNQSLALNASSPSSWINRGQILYNIGYYYQDQLRDPATAKIYYNEQLDAFNQAISVDPNNAEAWFNKGYALCGMGRCTEGITAFQEVQTLNPNYPYLQLNLAQAEQLAATETPFYVKYAAEIVMLFVAIAAATFWYTAVRKKN